jgi:hypothetical protein
MGANLSILPREIRLLCPGCGTEQAWESRPPQANDKIGVAFKRYSCKNCNKCHVAYFYRWDQPEKDMIVFQKAGQFPPLEETISPALEKALSKDSELYKRALRSRNFNYGLGAVSYMRRIIENHMNEILDILTEVDRPDIDEVTRVELERIKKSRTFTAKVEHAAKLLPEYLRPIGLPNPLDILYELSSEGLHMLSEEECVVIFDKCQTTFEYLLQNLRPQLDQAKSYKENLRKLSQPRTPAPDKKAAAG